MGGYWSSSNRRGNREGIAGGQAKITVNQRRADKKADKQMKGLQQQLL
jgi:hypothetical protein